MCLDRRDPRVQRARPGGRRRGDFAPDPPLTTRDCADYLSVSPDFIRAAIDEGQLEAEQVTINGRRLIRIHADAFRAYLVAIGWKRLPRPARSHCEPRSS